MTTLPVIEEQVLTGVFSRGGHVMDAESLPVASRLLGDNRLFKVYPADAGFNIMADIDQASEFALEPNIFFSPRFCVSAMPRLDERQTRLMVLQDVVSEEGASGKTRFLMPFTVEKPGFAVGPDVIRAWSNPYAPYGLPLVERRETAQIIDDVFETLQQPGINLPKVLVLPDVFTDSPLVSILRSVALANGLPLAMTKTFDRPWLDATQDADDYFDNIVSSHHRRNFGRQWRQLEKLGDLSFQIARSADEVRVAMEEFLLLENAGWKGKARTSLVADRYRAAFAREAVNLLAERDRVRVYALTLQGKVIASLITFVEAGRAWTWKTAFDEKLASASPGTLLMIRTSEALMDDPNITEADSCAMPDHPMMTRLWVGRRPMTTLVIGLNGDKDREVRQAAAQIDLYRSTRQTAKNVRDRLRNLIGK